MYLGVKMRDKVYALAPITELIIMASEDIDAPAADGFVKLNQSGHLNSGVCQVWVPPAVRANGKVTDTL